MRSVARESAIASGRRGGPRHQREVTGLDRHVGAGPDRDPQVGTGERRHVVDAVADHRDPPALGLERRRRAPPSPRAGPRRPRGRCRPPRRRHAPSPSRSPVTITVSTPRSCSTAIAAAAPAWACRRRGTRLRPCRSDPRTPGSRPAPRPRVATASIVAGTVPTNEARPTRIVSPRRRPRHRGRARWRTRSAAAPPPPDVRKPVTTARTIGCSDASSAEATERARLAASTPGASSDPTSVIRPVVTVPVLSSTATSTRAGCLEHFPALDDDAELGAATRTHQ